MTIETDVVSVLTAAGVTAVYPSAAPQDAAKPFVVYRVAKAQPITTIHGTTVITGSDFVFECWAANVEGARTLASSVRTAIDASVTLTKERIAAPEDGYDPDVDEYVEPVSYRFWHQ